MPKTLDLEQYILMEADDKIILEFVPEDLKEKIITYYQFRMMIRNLSKAVYLHDIKENQIILKYL